MKRPVEYEIPPDRPSPLPAWQQYYISKYAEERVMNELENHHPDTMLVGLGIGYQFVSNERHDDNPENKFYMCHGYMMDCEEAEAIVDEEPERLPTMDKEEKLEEDENTEGLDDKFIHELYQEVKALILQNVPLELGRYLVSVEVTTAHFSTPRLSCKGEKCKYCSTHRREDLFTKKKKNNKCVWECTGEACED